MGQYHRQLISQHEKPDPQRIALPQNRSDHPKPHGGLWTSSPIDATGIDSEWTQWLEYEMGTGIPNTWAVEVSEHARVFHIDSLEKEQEFIDRYRSPLPQDEWEQKLQSWTKAGLIDWERVSQEWDGVQWQPYRGFSRVDSPFSMWDVESTWWARWAFDGVELACKQRGNIQNKNIENEEEIDLENLEPGMSLKDALGWEKER